MGDCGLYARVVAIKGSSHRLLSVHCHGSVTINKAKCPLSPMIQLRLFSLLLVFDNKMEPAAGVPTGSQRTQYRFHRVSFNN